MYFFELSFLQQSCHWMTVWAPSHQGNQWFFNRIPVFGGLRLGGRLIHTCGRSFTGPAWADTASLAVLQPCHGVWKLSPGICCCHLRGGCPLFREYCVSADIFDVVSPRARLSPCMFGGAWRVPRFEVAEVHEGREMNRYPVDLRQLNYFSLWG